jgi:hypothetical protein
MTRNARFLLCAALACFPFSSAWAAEEKKADDASLPTIGQEAAEGILFAKSIEDLPVMKGLEIEEDKDLIFVFGDKRIAQTTLRGWVDIDEVYYFYRKVLPSLGWKFLSMRQYERNGENLAA